jgi:hypothetical protein
VSDEPKSKVRRRVTSAVASVTVVLFLLACIAAVKSRADFGTFAFWKPPNRVDYCERRYHPSPRDVEGTPAEFTGRVDGGPEWLTIGHTLTGRSIHGVVLSRPRGSVCSMALYIHISGSRYRLYGLSGGP